MVNLRLYAIHEFDPLAAESVVQDADVIASPAPLHRSSRLTNSISTASSAGR
jgi:hypothetical protein